MNMTALWCLAAVLCICMHMVEHPQTDAAIGQILHRADQVGERSAEAVELPNDQDIAVAQ